MRRCAELGILIDVSHLNEAGFWDVATLDVGPVVASHSGVHKLCPTSRNLLDSQLDAIGSSGGLVGIVFAVPFLRADFADDPDTPLSLIAEHARYVADRIGVAHVALGSDYDGATIPAPLGDVAGTPKLLAALGDAGFSEAEVAEIAWDNWRRVLGAWWRSEPELGFDGGSAAPDRERVEDRERGADPERHVRRDDRQRGGDRVWDHAADAAGEDLPALL